MSEGESGKDVKLPLAFFLLLYALIPDAFIFQRGSLGGWFAPVPGQ